MTAKTRVDDFFERIEPQKLSPQTWEQMLNFRQKIFTGFATLEVKNGFVAPKASFSTSQGQEMLRIMFFRVIEEVAESLDSQDVTHMKEEIIDATNYLLSAVMLDETYFPLKAMVTYCYLATTVAWGPTSVSRERLNLTALGLISYLLGSKLGETFRNRAWMNNTQAPYYEGAKVMKGVLQYILILFFTVFEDWDDFYRFYMAKNKVLEFRLESGY